MEIQQLLVQPHGTGVGEGEGERAAMAVHRYWASIGVISTCKDMFRLVSGVRTAIIRAGAFRVGDPTAVGATAWYRCGGRCWRGGRAQIFRI